MDNKKAPFRGFFIDKKTDRYIIRYVIHSNAQPAGQEGRFMAMYIVYEIFKSDGKRFFLYESKDRFSCEVFIYRNKYDATQAVRNGDSYLIIERC